MDSIIVIPALNPPESLVSYVEGLIGAGADVQVIRIDGEGVS